MPTNTIMARTSLVLAFVALAGTFTTSVFAQVVIEEEDDGHNRTVWVKRGGDLGHRNLSEEYCKGKEECKVEVKVVDGERIVIVNGDTVETGEMMGFAKTFDNFGRMFKRMQRDRMIWRDPSEHGFAFFSDNSDDLDLLGRPHFRMHRQLDFLTDDTLREMERDARKLARKARTAEDVEEAQFEEDLNQKLSQIFDYKNGKRLDAIEATERQLDEMRERQGKRESSRDEIIEQRKQELLGEESYLEW